MLIHSKNDEYMALYEQTNDRDRMFARFIFLGFFFSWTEQRKCTKRTICIHKSTDMEQYHIWFKIVSFLCVYFAHLASLLLFFSWITHKYCMCIEWFAVFDCTCFIPSLLRTLSSYENYVCVSFKWAEKKCTSHLNDILVLSPILWFSLFHCTNDMCE